MEVEELRLREEYEEYKARLIERPEDHPKYAEEWRDFWQSKTSKSPDPDTTDFTPEWKEFWPNRLQALLHMEFETKLNDLKLKYKVPSPSSRSTIASIIRPHGGIPSASSNVSLENDEDLETAIQNRLANISSEDKLTLAELLSEMIFRSSVPDMSDEDLKRFIWNSIQSSDRNSSPEPTEPEPNPEDSPIPMLDWRTRAEEDLQSNANSESQSEHNLDWIVRRERRHSPSPLPQSSASSSRASQSLVDIDVAERVEPKLEWIVRQDVAPVPDSDYDPSRPLYESEDEEHELEWETSTGFKRRGNFEQNEERYTREPSLADSTAGSGDPYGPIINYALLELKNSGVAHTLNPDNLAKYELLFQWRTMEATLQHLEPRNLLSMENLIGLANNATTTQLDILNIIGQHHSPNFAFKILMCLSTLGEFIVNRPFATILCHNCFQLGHVGAKAICPFEKNPNAHKIYNRTHPEVNRRQNRRRRLNKERKKRNKRRRQEQDTQRDYEDNSRVKRVKHEFEIQI